MSKEIYKVPHRVVLYARDIRNITGKSESSARRLLRRIRLVFAKSEGEFVTIHEFCAVTGIQKDVVTEFLKT
jgi:hypothetical protein